MRNEMLDCADDANLNTVIDLRHADDSAWNDLIPANEQPVIQDAKETNLEFRQRLEQLRLERGRKNDRLVFKVEEKLATMETIMPANDVEQEAFLAKLDSMGWSLISLASAAVLSDCQVILEYGITAEQYANGDF